MNTISTFTAQQPLFRAYDIRGARQYFTADFVVALGHAFAKLYLSQSRPINCDNTESTRSAISNIEFSQSSQADPITVVIGYDVRIDSDTIAQTLADILSNKGLRVIKLGLITTPMMAFWAQRYNGHGIMVTASHSTKDILGIKWLTNNNSPSGLDIQALYQQLSAYNATFYHPFYTDIYSQSYSKSKWQSKWNNNLNYNLPKLIYKNSSFNPTQNYATAQNENSTQNDFLDPLVVAGLINTIDLPAAIVAQTYTDAITQVFVTITQHNTLSDIFSLSDKLDVTIVIDCMHGATSNIAKLLFERFCQRVIMLNDSPDGSFPTGNPDPTEPNRLAELQQTVIVNEADMGLAFDGDGDRLMIVDNSGKVIVPDHLLYLLAQVAFTERPNTSNIVDTAHLNKSHVLFDVKCSHHLPKLLSELGTVPIMTKTGSSLLRQQLQTHECQALFAGELSGHFIFNDGYFIAYDDAMYASLRLLHWLAFTAPCLNNVASSRDGSTGDKALIITNIWGEPKLISAPYQLTDITKSLPIAVSSADHYLPLSRVFLTGNNSCSFVEHLVEYCRYLQRLANDPTTDDVLTQKSIFTESLSCTCFSAKPPLLKTKAIAKQLLPPKTRVSSIDGLRLDFAHGFGVVRRSNTSNCLTVRFAGDTLREMRAVQARFVAICRLFDVNLAEQMATIQPEQFN